MKFRFAKIISTVIFAMFLIISLPGCGPSGGGSGGSGGTAVGATASISVSVGDASLPADGISSTTITISLDDSTGSPVSEGTSLTITTNLGSFRNGEKTYKLSTPDGSGTIVVALTAGEQSGKAELIISSNGVTQKCTVIIAGAGDIMLTATLLELLADGESTSNIQATVYASDGTPIKDGTRVNFSIISGSGGFYYWHYGSEKEAYEYTSGGSATVTYRAPESKDVGSFPQTVTIRVSIPGEDYEPVTIDLFLVKDVGGIQLLAIPDELLADGSSESLITATVTDGNGAPAADGTRINFNITSGTGGLPYYASSYGYTSGGVVSKTYRASETPGIVTISVSSTDGSMSAAIDVRLIKAVGGIAVSATPDELLADGSSESLITATVTDETGAPAADGTRINFNIISGTGGLPYSTTAYGYTSGGVVSITYRASKTTGTVTIRVSSTDGTLSNTVDIELIEIIGSVTVSANPTELFADGTSTSTITALLLDPNGLPVPDYTTVSFNLTGGGRLSWDHDSTQAGLATTTYYAGSSVGTARIEASVQGSGERDSVTITLLDTGAGSISLSANPLTLTADGESSSQITATLRDSMGNSVPKGTSVVFTTTLGTFSNGLQTITIATKDTSGTIVTSLVTGTDAGIAQVAASFGGISQTIKITFQDPYNFTVSKINLSSDPPTLPADGSSQAIISATLEIVGGGTAPDGTMVSFAITEGGGTISPSGTTVNGTAIATLTSSSTQETVTIQASVIPEIGGRVAEIEVEYTPGGVTLTIIPNSLLGTGEQTSAVTATVLNAAGDPVDNEAVNFTLDDGSFGALVPPSVLTDGDGQAHATFTEAAKGGVVTITAEWNGVTGSETIDIQPPPAFIEVADGSPDPTSINIKGTGGQSTSQVIFDIKDSQGFPVADGYRVDFVIDSGPDGGEAIQPLFALTADGKVSTILRSGLKSGPVSIKATYFHNTDVSTTTSQITINAGPPVGEEFGIFAEYLNISGLWRSNLEDGITANVGDIYGNPVPDNTAISFKTYNTGGLMETADALTSGGLASKILRSTSSPSPMEGFVSVTAEANNGGRTTHVTALAIPVPPDNNYIYAGTDGGGVYKSTDFGASWANISRSSSIQGQNWIDPYVNDLSVNPDESNTIYAATGYLGEGHVYRSLDGGSSWNSNNVEEWNGVVSLGNSVLTVLCDDGTDYVWAGTEGLGAIFTVNGEDFQWGGTVTAPVANPNPGDGRAMSLPLLSGTTKSETWTATYRETGASPSAPVFTGIGQGTMDDVSATAGAGNQTWTATYQGGFDYSDNPVDNTPTDHGDLVVLSAPIVAATYTVTCTDGTDGSEVFSVLSTAAGLLTNFTDISTNYVDGELSFYVTEDSPGDFVTGDVFTFDTGADNWEVEGSDSGIMTRKAQTGVAYTSDAGQVAFTIEEGLIPYRFGDEWSFETTVSGEWQVAGSVSGVQNKAAYTGLSYISDSSEIYFIITSGTTPFKTDDKFSFTVTASGLGAGKIVRDIVKVTGSGSGSAADLFAATPTGVFVSTSGGTIWNETASFTGDNITTLAAHPNGNIVYAGTRDAGVWYSDDDGLNWHQFIVGLGEGLSATDPVADSGNTGNGVMSEVMVSAATLSENWTVTCLSEAPDGGVFTVTGTVSGLQTNQATVGSVYVSDGGEISFTIADGSIDFATGDKFTFGTTRDQGRHIKDLLVDNGNDKLYAITYFWGAEEPHAVGNVYVHGLQGSGLPDGSPWAEANSGLPEFSDDDPSLLAQHVMAPNVAGTPTALYIGGEGISFLKATTDLAAGTPVWQPSQSGLTNLVMARMPILFSGECTMYVYVDTNRGIFTVYIQDVNGNPPIVESHFIVELITLDDKRETLFEITYPDTYVYEGTFRDISDTLTDNPFQIAIPTPGTYKRIEFIFEPTCEDEAPGCSGSDQTVTYSP